MRRWPSWWGCRLPVPAPGDSAGSAAGSTSRACHGEVGSVGPTVRRTLPVTPAIWKTTTTGLLKMAREWEREREMFYLTTHSTHFIYGYMASRHMVKDHSDSEKGNPLLPHRLLLSINSKGSFICTIPDRITHITAFVTPVVEHWLEREIAQWVHPMKDRSDDPPHHERTLYLWATSHSVKKAVTSNRQVVYCFFKITLVIILYAITLLN